MTMLRNKRTILVIVTLTILVIVAFVAFYYLRGSSQQDNRQPNISEDEEQRNTYRDVTELRLDGSQLPEAFKGYKISKANDEPLSIQDDSKAAKYLDEIRYLSVVERLKPGDAGIESISAVKVNLVKGHENTSYNEILSSLVSQSLDNIERQLKANDDSVKVENTTMKNDYNVIIRTPDDTQIKLPCAYTIITGQANEQKSRKSFQMVCGTLLGNKLFGIQKNDYDTAGASDQELESSGKDSVKRFADNITLELIR